VSASVNLFRKRPRKGRARLGPVGPAWARDGLAIKPLRPKRLLWRCHAPWQGKPLSRRQRTPAFSTKSASSFPLTADVSFISALLILAAESGMRWKYNLKAAIFLDAALHPADVYGRKCWIKRGAFDSAKNHKRQRRKRQSVTAKREKSQTPKFV